MKRATSKYDTEFSRARRRLKLTIAEVATRIGVSTNTAMNYESGRSNPRKAVLLALSFLSPCLDSQKP